MRVAVPKPKRTYLEADELAYLLDAAADQDDPLMGADAPPKGGTGKEVLASPLRACGRARSLSGSGSLARR